jgi:hypothetical protein
MSVRESLRTALDEMRAEHERLGDAIAVIEKLVDGEQKKRGGYSGEAREEGDGREGSFRRNPWGHRQGRGMAAYEGVRGLRCEILGDGLAIAVSEVQPARGDCEGSERSSACFQ